MNQCLDQLTMKLKVRLFKGVNCKRYTYVYIATKTFTYGLQVKSSSNMADENTVASQNDEHITSG